MSIRLKTQGIWKVKPTTDKTPIDYQVGTYYIGRLKFKKVNKHK